MTHTRIVSVAVIGMVLAVLALTSAAARASEVSVAQLPDSVRDVTMTAEWNLVGWTGPNVSAGLATDSIASDFDVMFGWDAASQAFLSYSPMLPPVLNTLEMLELGRGYWVHVTNPAGTRWRQPIEETPWEIPLVVGQNLVLWGGASGMPVESAMADLGDALISYDDWDVYGQRFRSYRPLGPLFLNTAESVLFCTGIWVEMRQPLTWRPLPFDLVAGVSVAEDEVVQLAPGGRASLAGTPLQVRFDGVLEDTRCPAGAICPDPEFVRVLLTTFIDREPQAFVRELLPGFGADEIVGGFEVSIESVDPVPSGFGSVAPEDYRLTLALRRDRNQPALVRAEVESIGVRFDEGGEVFVALAFLLTDSCQEFDHVTITRVSTFIFMDVWLLRPPPAVLILCAATAEERTQGIQLGSDFAPGVFYTAVANSVDQQFQTPSLFTGPP